MRRCNIKGRKAAALGYNPQDGVPRLLAKGRDREAEQIIEIARKAGIEIVEDSALVSLLDSSVNPGDWLPPWCWEAVAKILAFVLAKEKIK
ncbi:MAG: EscU/YscU/HrcU family type III secretion system export apparatus switch protein [Treponema sp.]|jgi:flagellar biosynthesis protein|nr:EscU/YscU/HrcU family type III secretion system export apparatus switch protein [Treponema sp.]